MIDARKSQIREALVRYLSKTGFMSITERGLADVAEQTIENVIQCKWDLVSEDEWLAVAGRVGFFCGHWQQADTGAGMLLQILFNDALHFRTGYGIAMSAGMGKTYAAAQFIKDRRNVFYISCRADHNRLSFMTDLMEAMNIVCGDGINEMAAAIDEQLAEQEEALLLIDDAHLLKDRVIHLLSFLSTHLAGKAGLVVMGNVGFREKIIEGVRLDKAGYNNLFKALGRRFISMTCLGKDDVANICRANNVADPCEIAYITQQCNGNLHPIAMLVQDTRLAKMAA